MGARVYLTTRFHWQAVGTLAFFFALAFARLTLEAQAKPGGILWTPGPTILDVIAMSFRRDIEYHALLLQSLAVRGGLFRHVVTVVPEADVDIFLSRFSSLPSKFQFKASIHSSLPRFCDIMDSDAYADADAVVFFDSDMVLTRNATLEDFMDAESGAIKLRCGPFPGPIFEMGNKPSIDTALGINSTQMCLGRQVFPQVSFKLLRERIMSVHNLSADQFCLVHPRLDMYSPLGTFLLYFHPDLIKVYNFSDGSLHPYYSQHDSKRNQGVVPEEWREKSACFLQNFECP